MINERLGGTSRRITVAAPEARVKPCSLEVRVKGKALKEFKSPTNGQTYVEGREGSEFSLKFHNPNGFRVLVILSVDGLSVLNGEAAGPESNGYVIDSYGSIDLTGWTVDQNTIAKFTFSGSKGDSYAEKIGEDAFNKGVIGALVFREKPPVKKNYRGYDSGDYFGVALASASPMGGSLRSATFSADEPQDMGTAFGEAAEFKTTTTTFDRGEQIDLLELYYDSAQGLKRVGINVTDYDNVKPLPKAFPGTGCRIPEGWTDNR